ncbi:HNH endonuclease [Pseudomonas sp. CCI1.2]|uniref:HNH endonuclease n=1 Tax=unclassified Pseudomonas TaxID=196821 RepID=UPI002AC94879|nr:MULTISPECIES: HNH endonuclease [unclassified Pseudomonas]MEB0092882.1 HNH endonuclease [Pseudomonas sp. CCI4.2]MEB0120514.1 HNH endonuclease [Pseudomonas sp. CCI1.2]WPX55471.1 HNH endonuclease [Pseudomonas sp. CCI4.2]
MALCALCDVEITEENDSREHIIPNSIGGRKKVKGFICNPCNNQSGGQWDTELARQLNPLSLIFHIKRERGQPPSQTFDTTSGEKLTLHHQGGMSPSKPEFKEEMRDNKTAISIIARDAEEAKRMLRGVKKKYPSADTDKFLNDAAVEYRYLDGMLKMNLEFGGPEAGRSVVKTVLALASHSGISPGICEHAISYLRHDGVPCFGYYYERDLLINRPPNVPLHCVAISGDPETGLLLGYLEYYGIRKMVVCLSEKYSGSKIAASYSFDPTTGTEQKTDVDISLTIEEIAAAYNYEKCDSGSVVNCFHQVMPRALKASFEREQNRVISDAVNFAFKNCGAEEGQVLTDEQVRVLTGKLAEKMVPYILSQIKINK